MGNRRSTLDGVGVRPVDTPLEVAMAAAIHRLLSKYTTLWLKEFLPQSHSFLCHLTRDHLFTFTVSHPTCPATHTDSTNLPARLLHRYTLCWVQLKATLKCAVLSHSAKDVYILKEHTIGMLTALMSTRALARELNVNFSTSKVVLENLTVRPTSITTADHV